VSHQKTFLRGQRAFQLGPKKRPCAVRCDDAAQINKLQIRYSTTSTRQFYISNVHIIYFLKEGHKNILLFRYGTTRVRQKYGRLCDTAQSSSSFER
jgi:hypothetical protein